MRQHALKNRRVELDESLREVVEALELVGFRPGRELLQALQLGFTL
jgi:hypothetical protein